MHRLQHRLNNRLGSSTQCRRYLVGLFTASLGASAIAQQAPAPAAPADENVLTLEAFVTTGSNIQRMDSENVLPVTVFNKSQIQARDAATSFELLESISQITTFPKNETSTNAVAARGGNAAAALRGLAQGNTLVLLNGRRMPYNPFSSLTPADSTVNVNTLPSEGLRQVEVLRDGASAIYGADAVAGVINFITDPEITGGTMSVRLGQTEHGGGGSAQATLNYGTTFAEGKGRWVSTLSIYNRDAIYFSERERSESTNRLDEAVEPWTAPGSAYDGRSNTTQWPSFRLGEAALSGTTYWFYPPGGTGTPTLTRTSLPRDQYLNYNQYIIGQPFSTRANLYSQVEFDMSDQLTAFAEVLGYYAESKTGRAPISLRSSDAVVTLNVDNPYNPYGSAFNAVGGAGGTKVDRAPTPITISTKLLVEGGPERVETSDRVFRLLGGFKGTFGTSSWSWETAAMYGAYRATDYGLNGVRDSLLIAAADRTDANAWNPFGYTFKVQNGEVVADQEYVNPAAVQESYTVRADRVGNTSIASIDFRAGGEVVELWAGPISASFGGEYRVEEKEDYKPPFISVNPPGSGLPEGNNDLLVTSPKYNYLADRSITSIYGETVIPLVAPKNNVPLSESLELTASIRHENYDDFGTATKPKFGVNWKPVDWLMVRASYNEGFHAPDLTDMNQPASFTVGTPPGTRDTVRDNYFTGAGLGSDYQVLQKSYTTPNPDLGPEESEGISAGVVVQVPFVKGLSVSVDYWEISQDNLIVADTRSTARDEAMLLAYTQQQLAAGKNIMDINVGSFEEPGGSNTYVGDPFTLRAPVTQEDRDRFAATYAVLPQSQWIAPLGRWIGVQRQLINTTGTAFTNGFDYQVDYNLPRTSIGAFRFSTTWSMFLNKFVKQTPDDEKDDEIDDYTLPKWKSSSTLIWRNGPWSATANFVWQSEIATTATTNLAGYTAAGEPDYIKVIQNDGNTYYYEVGDPQYQLNLGASYRFGNDASSWLRNTTFRVGVNNALDDEPAIYDMNGTGYSGGTGTSLWVGRSYTLTLTREF